MENRRRGLAKPARDIDDRVHRYGGTKRRSTKMQFSESSSSNEFDARRGQARRTARTA
jgi:hypothetical protein